jgi:hypothetical protein
MSTKAREHEEQVLDAAPHREVTAEEIEVRAYEIHLSGVGGNELDNWLQAEAELTAELQAAAETEAATDDA